jgi:hypothetical protein
MTVGAPPATTPGPAATYPGDRLLRRKINLFAVHLFAVQLLLCAGRQRLSPAAMVEIK